AVLIGRGLDHKFLVGPCSNRFLLFLLYSVFSARFKTDKKRANLLSFFFLYNHYTGVLKRRSVFFLLGPLERYFVLPKYLLLGKLYRQVFIS
ncbi:MAG: hypothetical protein KID04_17460, partial [Clostridium sp.]|nr:hypothetical protein [Clostridium sp.]